MSRSIARAPRAIRGTFLVLFAWLAAYEVRVFLAPHDTVHGLFAKQAHLVALVVAGLLVLLRAVRRREDRLAWSLIGIGVLAWAFGEIYYTSVLWNLSSVPSPTAADGGYLLFPVLAFAGICLLARRRGRGAAVTLWADGVTGAFAVGAVSAAFVLDEVLRHATGSELSVITNLAYPVTDLIMLGGCITLLALGDWRLDRTWAIFGAGIIVFWISDSVYLVQNSLGTYVNGGPFDMGWWLGLALIALAAWQPASSRAGRTRVVQSWMIVWPITFAALAVGVLVYGSLRPQPLNVGAVVLAAGAIVAVMVRLGLTFRASVALLRVVHAEALTDALTGMPNRRALIQALVETVEESQEEGRGSVLALYDLDGFKAYNDAFGHQAGDALLARLGVNLQQAVGGGAYRMGGDEFCVLLPETFDTLEPVLRVAAEALSEHGEGFTVTASWGAVSVPAEATSAEDALRVADQRMYANKRGGRSSTARESTDVLLRALAERYPDLDAHSHDVAALAFDTAQALGLGAEESETVRIAAELHDIGKVAIPEKILAKPGPLDEREWEYMRRHSEIGQRILAAAPSLQRVAMIVRASHERFDGRGYPDRLAGDAIPVGARIIAVCDAFDAMVSDRPYSPAMSRADAVAELTRCAGGQFDPRVVTAFCEVVDRVFDDVRVAA